MKRRKRGQKTARKKHKPNRRKRAKPLVPRTAKQFFAMSPESQDAWNRAVHAISEMRKKRVSLREAARRFGIDPRVAAWLGRSALRKRKNGRYVARPSDQLLRILAIPTPDGLRELALRSSRQASLLGEYWAAVQLYLEVGDASKLQQFDGEHVTGTNRERVPLLTDLRELSRLGNAGQVSFESLYARVG